MTEEDKLAKADEIDKDIRTLAQRALKLRNEVLEANGWQVTKELIGPSYTYFYQKGKTVHLCEFEALAEDGLV